MKFPTPSPLKGEFCITTFVRDPQNEGIHISTQRDGPGFHPLIASNAALLREMKLRQGIVCLAVSILHAAFARHFNAEKLFGEYQVVAQDDLRQHPQIMLSGYHQRRNKSNIHCVRLFQKVLHASHGFFQAVLQDARQMKGGQCVRKGPFAKFKRCALRRTAAGASERSIGS